MKLFIKTVLIIIILALTLILLLQIDDDLHPETKQWVESTEQQSKDDNQAYFYFLGLMAPEGKSPIKVGQIIHQDLKARSLPNFSQEDSKDTQTRQVSYKVYDIDNALTVQDSSGYCRAFEANCFQKLLSDKSLTNKIIEDNKTLHQRYQTFLNLPGYKLMHPIRQYSSWPNYLSLVSGNNLSLISIFGTKNEVQLNQQYRKLLDDTRLKLAQSGSTTEKMMYVTLINHNLQFYNLLYKHEVVKSPIKLKSLTSEEKDIFQPMSRELLSGTAISNHFEIPWYKVTHKAVLKKNMILNGHYQVAHKFSQFSKLPPHQQITEEARQKVTPQEVGFLDKYRNFAGWALSQVALPAYDDYINRVSVIDAKIAVLNWRMQQPANANIDQEYLKNHPTAELNPYKTGDFIIKDESFICVPLEIKDHRNTRCVQL